MSKGVVTFKVKSSSALNAFNVFAFVENSHIQTHAFHKMEFFQSSSK